MLKRFSTLVSDPIRYTYNHCWINLSTGYGGITPHILPREEWGRNEQLYFNPIAKVDQIIPKNIILASVYISPKQSKIVFLPVAGKMRWISPHIMIQSYNESLFQIDIRTQKLKDFLDYDDYMAWMSLYI